MGLFFTLLYVFVAYLTPDAIVEGLGQYHVEIILAVPTILCTIFALPDARILRTNQSFATFGLMIAVFMSMAATGWIGGAPALLVSFLPQALAFFFVAANCRKKSHLQMLVAVMLAVSVWDIFQGYFGELAGNYEIHTSYFIPMKSDNGDIFYRIRGHGVIQDPNDFAQFMLAFMPLMFLFWKKGKVVVNFLLIYLPLSIVCWGMYLTHSRGGLLGAGAALIVAGRKRFGVVRSAIVGGVAFVGLMAIGFTGGRDISAANGEDRMEAWSAGLEMIKSHPIFGVGSSHFTDYYHMTAHNSVIVCAAEVGFLGLFLWVLLLLSSMRDMYVLSELFGKRKKAEEKESPAGLPIRNLSTPPGFPNLAFAGGPGFNSGNNAALLNRLGNQPEPTPVFASAGPNPFARSDREVLPIEEISRMASLLLVSFAGFLTVGWFLSRALVMLPFLYAGIAVSIFRMARDQEMNVTVLPLTRALKLSLPPTIALVGIVYAFLRVEHMLGH